MIRVLHVYRNISGARIAAGDYEDQDPALQGLGQYLIDNGHAIALRVLEQSKAVAPAPVVEETEPTVDEPVADLSPAEIVRAHLEAHPEDANLSAAKLSKQLAVPKNIVADVLAEFSALDPNQDA